MRPMRRQDRAVTDPEKIQAVIDGCEICRLGFCDQGKPYVVPVNFGHAVENGHQLKPAEQACRYTAAFRSVIAEGPAVILETAEEKRRGLAAILRQSTGKADWEFPDAAVDTVCVCKLTAEALSCKEHL